jgi:hypothetical protein
MLQADDWRTEMVLKRAVCSLFFVVLSCGVLLAQNGAAVAHTIHSGPVTPTKDTPPALRTIFTNLGPTATDNYNDTTGYYVTGPTNSVSVSEQAIALPFTPKADSHVTVLQVAVGWISGTKLVDVGLYSDNAGVVGTALATGHSTHLPTFGSCCQLVTVNIPSTAVTAGTQYWIVASSDDTNGPDLTAVWQSSNDANTGANEALAGWFTFSNNLPAGAAKGTVP